MERFELAGLLFASVVLFMSIRQIMRLNARKRRFAKFLRGQM